MESSDGSKVIVLQIIFGLNLSDVDETLAACLKKMLFVLFSEVIRKVQRDTNITVFIS